MPNGDKLKQAEDAEMKQFLSNPRNTPPSGIPRSTWLGQVRSNIKSDLQEAQDSPFKTKTYMSLKGKNK